MHITITDIGINDSINVYDDFSGLSFYEIYKKAVSKYFIKDIPFEFENFEYSSHDFYIHWSSLPEMTVHFRSKEGEPFIELAIKNNRLSIKSKDKEEWPKDLLLIAQNICDDLNRLYWEGRE